jgi:hypothetical protein
MTVGEGMNTPKHTPGPWRIFNAGRGRTLSIHGPRGELGTNEDCVVNWPGFDSCDKPKRERVANARLIAAAPDLLEALEAFAAAEFGEMDAYRARLSIAAEKARAALTKARGQS